MQKGFREMGGLSKADFAGAASNGITTALATSPLARQVAQASCRIQGTWFPGHLPPALLHLGFCLKGFTLAGGTSGGSPGPPLPQPP